MLQNSLDNQEKRNFVLLLFLYTIQGLSFGKFNYNKTRHI